MSGSTRSPAPGRPDDQRRAPLALFLLLLVLLSLPSCASVDVVRLKPDQLMTPPGTEPVAGIQATCLGFYLFTLGLPYADLEKAVNELLMKEAKKLGADRVVELRFDATPEGGIWWLTKLLFWRSATAWAIAVRNEPGLEGGAPDSGPPPIPLPPPGSAPPAAASQPAGQ